MSEVKKEVKKTLTAKKNTGEKKTKRKYTKREAKNDYTARMGQRISNCMDERGWSLQETADQVNKYVKEHPELVPKSRSNSQRAYFMTEGAVSSLKNGRREASSFYTRVLAEIFGVSICWLKNGYEEDKIRVYDELCRVEDVSELKPLNENQLFLCDGFPVWIVDKRISNCGRYGLINISKDVGKIVYSDGSTSSFDEVKGRVYIGSTPFTQSMRPIHSQPIKTEKILANPKKFEGILFWIEPINCPDVMQNEFRGWYKWDITTRCFIGGDGKMFPDYLANQTFLIFADEVYDQERIVVNDEVQGIKAKDILLD